MTLYIFIFFAIAVNLVLFLMIRNSMKWYGSLNEKLEAIDDLSNELIELRAKFGQYSTDTQ